MTTDLTLSNLPRDPKTGLTLPLATSQELSGFDRKTGKPVRPVIVDGDVAYVTLTRGYVSVIDAEYAPLVGRRNWWAQVGRGGAYARCSIRSEDGRIKCLMLHTLISGFDLTDHIDGDGLNNRASNLRKATRAENNRNSKMQRNNKSGFKGVTMMKGGRYLSRIRVDGVEVRLGRYDTPEEAHEAYCEASRKYHGDFGRTE